MFQDTSLSPFPKSWLFTAHCLRAQERWCEAEGKSRASSWMDGSWMDGAGQLWNQKPGKYPRRSLYSFSGDIASRSSETGQPPGRKPVAEHGLPLAPPFPTWILLCPFSFGERLTTSHLLLSPPLTSPVSHQGFLGLLSPRSREMLLGRQPHSCAPGSGPSLLPGPELPVSSPSGPLWSGPLLIGPSLNE